VVESSLRADLSAEAPRAVAVWWVDRWCQGLIGSERMTLGAIVARLLQTKDFPFAWS
jgi:hypothetical protein